MTPPYLIDTVIHHPNVHTFRGNDLLGVNGRFNETVGVVMLIFSQVKELLVTDSSPYFFCKQPKCTFFPLSGITIYVYHIFHPHISCSTRNIWLRL